MSADERRGGEQLNPEEEARQRAKSRQDVKEQLRALFFSDADFEKHKISFEKLSTQEQMAHVLLQVAGVTREAPDGPRFILEEITSMLVTMCKCLGEKNIMTVEGLKRDIERFKGEMDELQKEVSCNVMEKMKAGMEDPDFLDTLSKGLSEMAENKRASDAAEQN